MAFSGITEVKKVEYSNREKSLTKGKDGVLKMHWMPAIKEGMRDYVEVSFKDGRRKVIYDINECTTAKK